MAENQAAIPVSRAILGGAKTGLPWRVLPKFKGLCALRIPSGRWSVGTRFAQKFGGFRWKRVRRAIS